MDQLSSPTRFDRHPRGGISIEKEPAAAAAAY